MEEKKPSLWDKTKNWIMGITTLFVAGGGTVAVVNEISQADHNKNKTEKWVDPKTGRLTGLPTIPVIKREKTEQEQAKEFTDRIRRDISIAQGEISEFSPADKNAIEVEGHQMSKGASIGYGKYEDEDSHVRLMEPTPGTKEAFMAEESKKFMDNIKIERFGNKSEKGESTGYYVRKNTDGEHIIYNADGDRVGKLWRPTGLPIIPVIKREKTEQEQAKEFTDRIRRDISIAQGEISEFSPADNNDFGDLADVVRAKSETLLQKKNGTDTPAPESKVADDKNKEAVLPKQPQLTSVRSKGGRKGGEPLGA